MLHPPAPTLSLGEYLRLLDEAQWTHFECPVPYASDSTRVHAIGATEVWIVDFFPEGDFAADVYGLRNPADQPITDASAVRASFGKLRRAWATAAADLGIRVAIPFQFEISGEVEFECMVHLPDFGTPRGVAIFDRMSNEDFVDAANSAGFYVPGLSPRYYEEYDRELFVETLLDWGWEGGGEPPVWYAALAPPTEPPSA